MSVWRTVDTAEAALKQLEAAAAAGDRPDLVLIDVSLPGMSGIELLDELKQRYPELPCLVLSGHTDLVYVRKALANGARGYVAKEEPAAVLDGVRAVRAGERYLNPDLTLPQNRQP